MKKIVTFTAVLLLAVFLFSCGNSDNPLINKWKEINNTMTLDINKDSTLTVKEYKLKSEGKWRLSDDGKTLVVHFAGNAEKELQIKALTEDSLVLSDNGLDMVFKAKHLLK